MVGVIDVSRTSNILPFKAWHCGMAPRTELLFREMDLTRLSTDAASIEAAGGSP